MAKFASRTSKELVEEEIFERKKKDMKALKRDNAELLKPDFARTANEVLQDVQYKGVVARAIGRSFNEREVISERDLQRMLALSERTPDFNRRVEIKLVPIMKAGKKWEDRESRKLRKQYVEKSRQLLDIISKFRFQDLEQSEEIFLKGSEISDKTDAYLSSASAVGLLDKGVKRRKSTRMSGSIYFRQLPIDGRKGAVFALFDGFDERGLEYLPSALAVDLFRESAKGISDTKGIMGFLEAFMKKADATISESVKGFSGASATCGIVSGGKLYYANVGNNRIYGVGHEGNVEKIAGDGIVEGEKMAAELKFPYLYLGGFTQRMKGKKDFKFVHNDFRLREPNIGVLEVSKYFALFFASSGVWKSAMTFDGGKAREGEWKLSEVFARARNPLNAVERMDMQVKGWMKAAARHGVVDDISMLYFEL